MDLLFQVERVGYGGKITVFAFLVPQILKKYTMANNVINQKLNVRTPYLSRMKRSSWQELSETTGCLSRCSYLSYSFTVESQERADWRKDWVSAFYLGPR